MPVISYALNVIGSRLFAYTSKSPLNIHGREIISAVFRAASETREMEACVRFVDPKASALSSAVVGQSSGGGEGARQRSYPWERNRSSSQF